MKMDLLIFLCVFPTDIMQTYVKEILRVRQYTMSVPHIENNSTRTRQNTLTMGCQQSPSKTRCLHHKKKLSKEKTKLDSHLTAENKIYPASPIL